MCDTQPYTSKPSHVRKLQFGQVILEDSVIEGHPARRAHGERGNSNELCGIPWIDKQEFVRKWIESHEVFVGSFTEEETKEGMKEFESSNCSEPLLFDKPNEHDLNSGELLRLKPHHPQDRNPVRNYSCPNIGSAVIAPRIVQEPELKDQPVRPEEESGPSSPILVRGRRRKRKLNVGNVKSNILQKDVEPCSKRSRNILDSDGTMSTAKCSNKEDLREKVVEGIENIEDSPTSLIFEDTLIEDASSDGNGKRKANAIIGTTIMEQEESTPLPNNAIDESMEDSDKTMSMLIEDYDTQGSLPMQNVLSNAQQSNALSVRSLVPVLEQTLSNGPMLQDISQDTALRSSVLTELSQSMVISDLTSPTRTPSDPQMFLSLVDSGKKKKKPKKGSILWNLHSLINSEISFVRIWRHRIKRPVDEDTDNPLVTIYVQACTTRFDKQLLQGFVLNDRHSLLPPLLPKPNDESNSSQTKSLRPISILLTPTINGEIVMKAESTVEIAPPWRLVDDKDLTIDVTYINTASNKKSLGINIETVKLESTEMKGVKVLNCICKSVQNGQHNNCRLNELAVIDTVTKDGYI